MITPTLAAGPGLAGEQAEEPLLSISTTPGAQPLSSTSRTRRSSKRPVGKFVWFSPPDLNRPGGWYVVEGVRGAAHYFRSALPPG